MSSCGVVPPEKNWRRGEEVFEGMRGGLRLTLGPEFGQAGGAKLDAFGVERFMEAVGGEQNRVSWRELHDVLVVAGGGEQAGGESAFSERLAGGVEGKWESGVWRRPVRG
jgi:hypothetical protein